GEPAAAPHPPRVLLARDRRPDPPPPLPLALVLLRPAVRHRGAGAMPVDPVGRPGHGPLASASARDTSVAASFFRNPALPCVSDGGSIWPAACSPMARQLSAVAGWPARIPVSTRTGSGPTPPSTTRADRQTPSPVSTDTAAATAPNAPR